MSEATETIALQETLLFALALRRLRQPERESSEASVGDEDVAQEIAEHSDVLMYGGGAGDPARRFVTLVEALDRLSRCPGGLPPLALLGGRRNP